MSDFVVKFPGRLRSSVEEMAAANFLPVPDLVRSVLQRAIFEHQLRKRRPDQK